MSNEYKIDDKIPNLYSILKLSIDVCKQPDCDEIIHKAYRKIAKSCHPDKNPGRTDAEEIFELVTSAYDILKSKEQRDAYNRKLQIKNQSSSDFFKLRKESNKYTKSLGDIRPPTDTEKKHFNDNMKMLDEKNAYVRDDKYCKEIPEDEAINIFSSLEKKREKESIKYAPDRLFDDKNFNLKKFNAAFEKVHTSDKNSMVDYTGVPSAWNDFGASINYSDFDNLDNLYVDDSKRFDVSRQSFSGIEFGNLVKISKDDIDNINEEDADYVNNHNKLEDNYYETLKAKLLERESDGNTFNDRKITDYDSRDTAGYGIFDQIGYDMDSDIGFFFDNELEDDITSRYEQLLLERNKDIKPSILPKKVSASKQKKMAR